MHLILIPTYHTITHICFGNEHTISSCVKMKSMTEEKSTVCGVMTSFLVSKTLSVRRAKAGSLLRTIQEVSALKLEENDILVEHGYHTAGSEPYFFINSYTYTKRLGAIPVDLNGRCVVAEEIGDRDKDTMHPLKWKCTNECHKLTSEEAALVLRTTSLFQMSIHHWRRGISDVNIVNTF